VRCICICIVRYFVRPNKLTSWKEIQAHPAHRVGGPTISFCPFPLWVRGALSQRMRAEPGRQITLCAWDCQKVLFCWILTDIYRHYYSVISLSTSIYLFFHLSLRVPCYYSRNPVRGSWKCCKLHSGSGRNSAAIRFLCLKLSKKFKFVVFDRHLQCPLYIFYSAAVNIRLVMRWSLEKVNCLHVGGRGLRSPISPPMERKRLDWQNKNVPAWENISLH